MTATELATLKAAVDGYDVLVQLGRYRLLAMCIVQLYHLIALAAQPRYVIGIVILANLQTAKVFHIDYRHRLSVSVLGLCSRSC